MLPCTDHTFFFEGMKVGGGGEPAGKVGDAIKASFGSFEEFSKQFKAAGATQFGSGWAWLVTDKGGMLTGAAACCAVLCSYFLDCVVVLACALHRRCVLRHICGRVEGLQRGSAELCGTLASSEVACSM